MDYASTTPLRGEVFEAMRPYFIKNFGNSGSVHAEGFQAKKSLDVARKSVALELQAHADEIIFTSGGTESNNLAIFGVAQALEKKGVPFSKMHFVTTAIEHSSVLECFKELESRGAEVDYVPVESNGIVSPQKIARVLRSETVLVSVQYANNEIGTIQPIRKVGLLIRDHNSKFPIPNSRHGKMFRTFFHADASQAPLYLDCMVERLGVDLMTLDGHKMHGPKGVGILYARRGTELLPILFGGGQERGVRSTTENVPLIVGFAKAFELASLHRKKESARLAKLRDYFYSNVLKNIRINSLIINGDMKERLPNNVNISLLGVDTEFAVLKLDAWGIAASTKSSCLGSEGASYVVKALGGEAARADSTLRFTFGLATTKKDVDYLLRCLRKII